MKGKVIFLLFPFLWGCKEISMFCEYKVDTISFPTNCTGVSSGRLSLLWKFTIRSGIPDISIGDVDGDGKNEVIASSWEMLYVLNGEDGSFLWSYHTKKSKENFWGIPLYGCNTPVLADVDCDERDEIVAYCMDGNLYAFNGEDGSILWKVPTESFSFFSVGKVNGRYEVIGTKRLENEEEVKGTVYGLNGIDGSLLWSSEPIPSFTGYNAPPSLGDINGDGDIDVVGGCGHPERSCGIIAINGKNGSILWSYSSPPVYTAPILADINGDGKLEVIVSDIEGQIYTFYGEDGAVLWKNTLSPRMGGSLAAVKVGDGYRIIWGNWMLNEKGEILKESDYLFYPLIGDIDSDGKLEVIARKEKSLEIYAIDIEDDDIQLLYEEEEGEGLVEEIRLGSEKSIFLLGDVNSDCILDLCAFVKDKIIALSLGVPVPPPHLLPWPIFQHDVKNTGFSTGNPYPPW